jgi:chromosome segregation ATPase
MAGPGARFWLALLVFLMPLGTRVRAQEPPGPVAPSPVPLASIAEAAAQARSWLKEVDSETLQATDPALLQADLLDWSLRLDRHLQENERILLDQPPLEVLRAREAALAQLSTPLETWRNLLSKRSELLENQAARLGVLRESWRATAAEAREKGSSQALVEEIDQVLASLEAATLRVQDHQARILDLQGQAALQEDRLARAASGLRVGP